MTIDSEWGHVTLVMVARGAWQPHLPREYPEATYSAPRPLSEPSGAICGDLLGDLACHLDDRGHVNGWHEHYDAVTETTTTWKRK